MKFILFDSNYGLIPLSEDYHNLFKNQRVEIHSPKYLKKEFHIVDTDLEEILSVQNKIEEDIIIGKKEDWYGFKDIRKLIIYDGYIE